MKTKYLLFSLFCLFAMACSEDKGNYDYTPINDLTISGIKDKTYVWTSGTTLKIPVTLERSLNQTEENLTYLWEIDGKKVSTDKNLETEIPAGVSYGDKTCRFSVTDKTNGVVWSKTFKVSIVSEFSWGYYFLTEKDDHSTVISFLPISEDETEIKSFLHATGIDGTPLGKYPKMITSTYGNIEALNTTTWNMMIVTGDEKSPVISTNTTTFGLTGIISSSNFADQISGMSFKPESVMRDPRGEFFFVSEGKVISYTKGLLYRPAKHTKEYYWSHPVTFPSNPSCGFFFDNISKKYYYLQPMMSDMTLYDQFALDEVIEYQNNRYFGDESIIGSGSSSSSSADYLENTTNVTVVSAANGNIYLTEYNYFVRYNSNWSPEVETKECKALDPLPLSGANADSKALLLKTNWYVTAGSSIYTSPKLLPKFTPFADISEEEYGKINNITTSAQGSLLVVTTYKEDSPEEMKGSVILIDIQSKKQYPYKNVIHRCVSIQSANAHAMDYPFPAGDGK